MGQIVQAAGIIMIAAAWVMAQIPGWLALGLLVLGLVIPFGLARHRDKTRRWRGRKPHAGELVHVDPRMAVRPTILGHRPPDGYRLASLYFGTGLIDRTGVLDHGFRVRVIDPIPDMTQPSPTADFADICDERGRQIVREARRRNVPIHLLWSGGLDSTTACIAMLKALGGDTARLIVYFNKASISEYPTFFDAHIKGKLSRRRLSSISSAFDGKSIVVTGEHGDQLFGSAKAIAIPTRSSAFPQRPTFEEVLRRPWQDGLLVELSRTLASRQRAELAFGYLAGQIERAPVPIPDLFTCYWWLNFSLKWQAVSLRMKAAAPGLDLATFERTTAHFFRSEAFQRWAMAHAGKGVRDGWQSYKWPARDYISAFTGDPAYAETKLKVPSLKGLIRGRASSMAWAMDARGTIFLEPIDRSLQQAQHFELGIDVDFGRGASRNDGEPTSRQQPAFCTDREQPLWDDMGDGE